MTANKAEHSKYSSSDMFPSELHLALLGWRAGDITMIELKQALSTYINKEKAKAELEGVEKFIADGWGERCETTDKQDFPDTDYDDPRNSRCPCCEMWEHFDEYKAQLASEGE